MAFQHPTATFRRWAVRSPLLKGRATWPPRRSAIGAELIEEKDPFGVHASGNGQDSYLTWRGLLHYHAKRGDPECCFSQMLRLLRERADWAHGGHEETRLEWRLVPAARRTDPTGGCPVGEEWKERAGHGTTLYELDPCTKAEDGLRAANLVTLEEIAGRTEEEIRSLDGVGPKSFRRLRQELEQRGLTFWTDEEAA